MVHILAFLGCFGASGLKLYCLKRAMLDRAAIRRLRRLDLVSSSSTGVIVLSGALMLVAEPGRSAHLHEVAFLSKLMLFLIASGLVLTTKGFLRRTQLPENGAVIATPNWMRWALLVDFVSIGVIATTGVAIAHGWA
jgi:uncharacterized membrane protein